MSGEARILVGSEASAAGVTLRLDDGEVLTVAAESLPPELPGVGGRIDSPLLEQLRLAAARKQAARRLFELLGRRLWSRARLHRKLCDEGLPAVAVAAVLDAAEAQGVHSDRLFAEAYCRDALRKRPVGRSYLQAKLRDQGVGGDLAAAVVAENLPAEQELELAGEAAQARWRRERHADQRALARVQRFLASRGFPAAVCRRAAEATRPRD